MANRDYESMLSRLEAKAATVTQKTGEKQEDLAAANYQQDYSSLPDNAFAAKYGVAAQVLRSRANAATFQEDRLAESGRFSDELIQDTTAGLVKGSYNLLSNTARLGQLAEQSNPLNLVQEGMQTASQLGVFGETLQSNAQKIDSIQDAGRAEDIADWAATDSAVADRLTARQSLVSQINAERVAQQTALDTAENKAEQAAKVAAGDSPLLAGMVRVGQDIADSSSNLAGNPTRLFDFAVEQVPSLVTGLLARANVSNRAVLELAQKKVARAGGNQGLTDELMQEARQTLMINNLGVVVGTMEAGGVYASTGNRIMEMPLDELVAAFPEAEEALAAGKPEDVLRMELADRAGATAVAIQGPLAAATSRISAGYALDPLGITGRAGRGAVKRVRTHVTDVVQETVEEGIQSGTGAVAENLGRVAAGEANVDVLDNVGQGIGEGAVGGGALTVGTKVPAALGTGVQATVGTVALAGRAAWQPVVKRAEANQAKLDAATAAKRAEVNAGLQTAAATVSQGLQEGSTVAAPVETDPALSPETAAELKAGDPTGTPLDRVNALSRAITTLDQGGDLPVAKQQELMLFSLKVARELRNDMQGFDNEDLTTAALGLVEHERVRSMEELVQQMPENELQGYFDALPADPLPEDAVASPQVLQALEQVKELAFAAPERLTVPQVEKALFHSKRMAPTEVRQLELALDVAKQREQHTEALAEIKKATKFKSQDIVATEISEEGFDLNGDHKKSVSQHVRDVSSAAVNGDVQTAKLQMQRLARFAAGLSAKASAFDAAAITQLDSRNEDRWFDVAGTRRLSGDQALGNLQNKVNLHVEKSVGLIDAVFADANIVANAYNALAKAYPQVIAVSGTDEAPLVPAIAVASAPTYKKHVPQTEVEDAGVAAVPTDADPAVAPEPAPVATASEPAEAAPAPDPAPTEAAETEAAVDEQPGPREERAAEPAEVDDDAAALAKILAEAQAVVDGAPAVEPTRTGTLDDALALTEDEYIAAINPTGKTTPDTESAFLLEELEDVEVPANAEVVREEAGITYHRADNFIYATITGGERVIGQLATISTGTTSAVAKDFQGRGIGTAMAKELIRANPFAPAGSFSASGEATRRRAFRELRAEGQPQTVAERFPLLMETMHGSKNQLLSGFKLAKKSQSLFARMLDPLTKLSEAIADGGLTSMLLPQHQHVRLDDGQTAAVGELVNDFVPALVAQFNRNLMDAAQGQGMDAEGNPRKGKGWLSKIFAPTAKTPEWDFANRKSLHATVALDGQLVYQPEIAQAMALAGIHWAMRTVANPVKFEREKIAPLYKNGIIPENLLSLYQSAHFYEQPLRTLAQDLTQLLGLQADANAPTNHTDGLAKALAADIAKGMHDLGLIDIVRERGPDEASLVFLRFNKSEDPKKWTLAPIKGRLKQVGALTRLLMPDYRDLPTIGTPSTNVPLRMQGSNQPLSDSHRDNLKAMNQIAFRRNGPLMEFLAKLGGENVLRLQGYQDVVLDSLNIEHRRSVEGKNNGLMYGWESLREIDTLLEQYAAANNISIDEAELYYGHRMISNGRIMQNGYGPQSDKLAREVLTANKATLDLNDERHLLEYYLTIAQALGIKTEQMSNIAATETIEQQLGQPEYRRVIGDIQALMASEDDAADLAANVIDQMQDLRVTTTRGMHALFAQARFEQAVANGDQSFEHYVAFELDGKTDGPINAMAHFGLHTVDAKILEQLSQGGWFINETERTTLNDHGKTLGDLYGTSGAKLQDKIRRALGNPKAIRQDLELLHAAIARLHDLKHITIDDEHSASSLEINRSIAKHGVMATVYGSGEKSIVTELAYEMLEKFYADINEALHNDRPLPLQLQNDIKTLMGQKRVKTRQGTKYYPVQLPDLNNKGSYQQLRFSTANFDALVTNLRGDVGGMLVSSINEEMAPVKETFKKIIAASVFQTTAMRRAFTQAVDAKRAELIKAGEIDTHDALSRNQEQEILQSLAHLSPSYALMNSEHGVNVGVKDFSGQFMVDGKVQKVSSITGALGLDINATHFDDPGVRALALYTIGLGDATMMSQMFGRPRNMLDVYDGLEVTAGEIFAAAKEVNEAVHTGWQFDAVGAVSTSFNQMVLDLDAMTDDELVALAEQLRWDGVEDMTEAELREALKTEVESLKQDLANTSARIQASKQAIGELANATDHMSGGQNPHLVDGLVVDDPVAYINRRVAEILAADAPASEPLVALDRTDVQLRLELNPPKSKLHKFVLDQIDHLLPEDLQVFIGTPAEIVIKQAELFPGVALGGPSEVGAFYRNTVFLKTTDEETLVHELVHATTIGLIRQYYANGGKGLTPPQKAAVRSLEMLATEFAEMVPTDTIEQAQSVVQGHLFEENMAEAVNEFMAWTLTNREVAKAMQRTAGSSQIKALAKKVLVLVRKMLGLPLNDRMESFLEQTLGQFHQLVRRPGIETPVDGMALFQSLAGPNNQPHAIHLEDVHQQFQRVLTSIPLNDRTPAQSQVMAAAVRQASEIKEAFLDAGFTLSDREWLVFSQVQATLATGIQLDPRTMTAMETLQEAALKQLTADDFLDNPASTDEHEQLMAQRRYNAMLGSGTQRTDSLGRSNLLANFVALGLVYQPLRRKLESLPMPVTAKGEKTLDGQIRSLTARLFDWLSRASTTGLANNQRQALDMLSERLAKLQETAVARSKQGPGRFQQLEDSAKLRLSQVGEKAAEVMARRQDDGKLGGIDGWINGLLSGVQALTNEDAAGAKAEEILSMTNNSTLPKPIRDLITEMVGIAESNAPVAQLLSRAKHMVSRVRQRLREEAPVQVRELFTRTLDEQTWETLHKAVGKTDLQALLGAYSANQIRRMLQNPAQLQTAIDALEQRLTGEHQVAWLQGAQDLGRYMTNSRNEAPLLRRNAASLARRHGEKAVVAAEDVKRAEPLLDRLVTLRAVQALGSHEQAVVAELLETEREGMESLLKLMRSLTQGELAKPGSGQQRFNRWKGYVPQSLDPRTDLVLANPSKGAELIKQGYRVVGDYEGDVHDPSSLGLKYYAVSLSGGQATYNQGALQTVESTIGGVDRLTGRTLDPAVKTVITHPQTVAAITRLKQAGKRSGAHNLMPIFNPNGEVVGYERGLDPALLEAHLRGNRDLAKAVGIWMGRQAEETIAREVNRELTRVLKQAWDDGKETKRVGEFVDVSAASDASLKEAWNAIPRETQTMLKGAFDNGPVMVRNDMLNNALGYRSASIADVFTGMSDLPEPIRKTLLTAALGLPGLGEKGYQRLVVLERTWQGLVGTAKDFIVVRSGVVALANGLSNQFQLLMHGIPPHKLLQLQAEKVQETETYLRAEQRLAKITVEMASATRPDHRQGLEREQQRLSDAQKRLSIYPLIQAGELPSIAEGLTEQDEYNVMKDLTNWLEKKAENLPKGVMTATRYATISKDTAIYQGLNRAIQFGDFMAKATLYDHLLAQGRTTEQALRIVNERFVNYNLLAGRSRDYLEAMGLTWFLNYKLRIQKVVLATMRENPLRFLMAGVGADWLGADSLIDVSAPNTSWTYAVGPGQFFRADEMLMWRQMTGL